MDIDRTQLLYGGGVAASFFGGMSAAGVGIGGGPFYLPVLILLVRNHHAVPLAKSNSLAVSAATLLINIRRKHPTAERPLTNYDLVLLLEPVTLLGTICGVCLEVLLPSTAIRAGLVALLFFIMLSLSRKGCAQYQEETDARASALDYADGPMRPQVSLESRGSSNPPTRMNSAAFFVEPELEESLRMGAKKSLDSKKSTRRSSRDGSIRKSRGLPRNELQYELFAASNKVLAEERGIPWGRISAMAVVAITCYGLEFFSRGGLALFCGSFWQRLSLGMAVLGIALWTFFWARHLHNQSKQWTLLGVSEKQVYGETLSWGGWNFPIWLTVAFVAGVFAGATGVSGGMLKAPFMIQMGLSPTVAAATSNFMVLFTSASTTFQFVLMERINYQDALLFGAFAFAGALLGQLVFVKLQERSRRQSFVTHWLSVNIGLASVCTVISWWLTEEVSVNADEACSQLQRNLNWGFGD